MNHVQLSQLLGCIEVTIEDVVDNVEGTPQSPYHIMRHIHL